MAKAPKVQRTSMNILKQLALFYLKEICRVLIGW